MKKYLLALFIGTAFSLSAQPNTEIYVYDLHLTDSGYVIKNPVNITHQNPGYDNQPHFTEQGELLFVSTRQGQTDVARVDLHDYSWTWLTATPGSEYSPTQIPESDAFSAINLETDGTQLLWKYPNQNSPSVIIPDLKIGYHCWYNKEVLASFVLGDPATLQVCNIVTYDCETLDTNIGRSLHKIPGEKHISYIKKGSDTWKIISLDPKNGKKTTLTNTIEQSEDMCWAPNGTIFMGKDNSLYYHRPGENKGWQEVKIIDNPMFNPEHSILHGITRLAINPTGDKIAIVVNQ